MKYDIFNGSGVTAQIAKGMALAFFALAFAELVAMMPEGEKAPQMPEEPDPAAHHAAFTLAHDVCAKNGADDLAHLYDIARRAHRTGEGREDMTPHLFGHYLAHESRGEKPGIREAFGAHVADEIHVPYVEFGAHSLTYDYS